MKTQQELRDIASRFELKGNILSVSPLGNGLINDTFKVGTDGPEAYVLQRVNNAVFRDVPLLQHNIEAVTRHIRSKLSAAGETDIDRKVLRFIPRRGSDETWWTDGNEWWRISVFIPGASTFETVNPQYSYYAGKAFGRFEAMLADIPDTLGEAIPDFHNMELRARQLHEAIAADRAGRLANTEVRAMADSILAYEEEMCRAERLHREGKLPKRICHCDTKVNNMLFDADGSVLCVIDLDTTMTSFVFSDFGDFLRIAANFVAEDDPRTEEVGFDMDIFRAFSKGYIESAGGFLTPVERENLPFGACLFPYMQCVRFFADYLNGDTYYRIKYPAHNWDRTRNQWALFQSVLSHKTEMEEWIASL